MRLELHNGLKDANKVLTKLRVALRGVKLNPRKEWFIVESYVNCREQGYAIIGRTGDYTYGTVRNFYCAFSQNRNSDSVVVYLATYFGSSKAHPKQFHAYDPWAGNIPSQEVYEHAQYFPPMTGYYEMAAKFIRDEIVHFLSDDFEASACFFGDGDIDNQLARKNK